MNDAAHAALERLFREEHGRVLASLLSTFDGDFHVAEDALQDAVVQALTTWTTQGVPTNPGAWLTATARRRAIDRLRKGGARYAVQSALTDNLPDPTASEGDETDVDMMNDILDERLKLMFTCCHPALPVEGQIALTLRTLGGLSTAEIARAFLVPVATMAQRLARAKTKIRDAHIPYRVPPRDLLPDRLDALLGVIYLIFNEGYVTSQGDALTRGALCDEAIRLCDVLIDLLPHDDPIGAEAMGLLALMRLHHARRAARTDSTGALVLLEDQDRSLWDHAAITQAAALLDRAITLGVGGPYQLQAAIAALHGAAATAQETDWAQIAALYTALYDRTGSPVIALNRAVAVAMAEGPRTGLRLLRPLDVALQDYAHYHAARADLLRRSGEREAAADAYERALTLNGNAQERAFLQKRINEMTKD